MEYKFKVGPSLCFGESPDEDTDIQALAESSMAHVEISYRPYCDDPAWTTAVREKLDASPVNINTVHASFSNVVDISRLDDDGQEYALDQIGRAITMAERLGADIVVLHGSAEPISEEERPKRIAKSQSSLRILGEKAQTAGVRLALELLPRTCLGNTADELEILLDGIPPEQAGFCVDANHPARPEHLPDIVKQLDKRIITLHISDYDGIDEKHWMPLSGIIDWAVFANTLRDIGYSGAFIYETKPDADTMAERLAIIKSNFEKILKLASEQ